VEETEKGLSLVELMVAIVVTLVITGAVFQLVTAGQPAFRPEPPMAERHPGLRTALDLISRDIYQAGYGVPDFAQVFTRSLNATGTMGSGGDQSDQLEMVRRAECGFLAVCDVRGADIFIVRYRINPDAVGVSNLERSPLGGANDSKGKSSWQILARGVEDMQVRYETAAGWSDDPGATSAVDTLVRRVRVRLSARSMEQNLTGQTTSAAGGNTIRGELEVAVAPRAAMGTLGMEPGEL
jgi:Tfp pilus assembly protein PilW